jgi:hypothetical protein
MILSHFASLSYNCHLAGNTVSKYFDLHCIWATFSLAAVKGRNPNPATAPGACLKLPSEWG